LVEGISPATILQNTHPLIGIFSRAI